MSGKKEKFDGKLDRRGFIKSVAATGAIATIAAAHPLPIAAAAKASTDPAGQSQIKGKYPHLFSPIKIAGHTYRNRILSSPVRFGFSVLGGSGAEQVYRNKEEWAKGGAAEVTVGETPINHKDAPDYLYPGAAEDYSKRSGSEFEAYKKYADVIKKHGAIAMIEIFHAGHARNPVPNLYQGGQYEPINPWGPMGFVREDGVTIEAFDAEKMKKVRNDFVTCSQFMKAVGFHGITIHGGHGFLFTQFLSPLMNRRTDRYGGNLLNRGRFPREIIGDIRKNLGSDFIIELRINGSDMVEGGTTAAQTAEFCSTLDGMVDIIHISSGYKARGYDTWEFTSNYEPHGVHVERAAIVKEKTNIPVTVVGGINSPEFAERVIAEGKVDFVSVARQLIADPEFPNKSISGREDEIRRCIRCYRCYPGPGEIPGDLGMEGRFNRKPPPDLPESRRGGGVGGCSINPRAGKHVEIDKLPKPNGSRNVIIVGGGPGGMQAAITACDRGHNVTLVEKDNTLGGVIKYTDTDLHKIDLKNFKDLLIREVGRRKIDVKLNTEATPKYLARSKPDAVILAIGASPSVPKIPGIDNAIHALDAYHAYGKVGKKVVMIGGGLRGCETAIHLADKGHDIAIIERLGRLASTAIGMRLTATIRQIEKRCNMVVRTGTRCVEITPQRVKVEKSGKAEVIECDTIVYSMAMIAKRPEVEKLRSAAGNAVVFEVGDCLMGANVFEAINEGFDAAMKIV